MRKIHDKLKNNNRVDNKQNNFKPARSIAPIKTTQEFLIEINCQSNFNIEEKAQAHLNYLSQLNTNTLDGNDMSSHHNNSNRISAWFTADTQMSQSVNYKRMSKQQPLCDTHPIKSSDGRKTAQKKRRISWKQNTQSHLGHQNIQRTYLTQYDDYLDTNEKSIPSYSRTILIIDKPRRATDVMERSRSTSVNGNIINQHVANLINRTLLHRKCRLPLKTRTITEEFGIQNQIAQRYLSMRKSNSQYPQPFSEYITCPKTSLLIGSNTEGKKHNLVNLNQFMHELTSQNTIKALRPSIPLKKRKHRRNSTKCNNKKSSIQCEYDIKNTITESFANNRLVRELYHKYDNIINRNLKTRI